MFTDCSSSTTSRLIHLYNRNGVFLPRPSVSQFSLRTTASTWRCTLSIRSSSSPSAIVIDGKAEAKKIRDDIKIEVSRMKESIGVVPAEDSSEEEVLKYVSGFNDDPSVHGVLVQLPLPSHMDEQNILNAVSIEKDVDGFHPLNIGRLAMRGREPLFVPCTPKGCIELLHRYNIEFKGKRAVVIGRSNIVGMPAALLLQKEDATVSIIHSRTMNPEELTRQADILISAVGKPNMVRGSWIKPGAVLIDVGIKPVEDPSAAGGERLVGDICYVEASKIASAITPVPGDVGPMTIAMLLSNTLTSAKRIHNFQ
ncbi:putative tetrahydrofolate synthase [Arabidopsis thaliana]|uniref:Bifunctional protein FolD 3, chloroplastic n=1 Tax=Arabidopsis thaliana TaxID=3702 RepID=FOLD3_ARATH|nr:Amino acid dehydrogenase family protein [Arabidopsis thaliana]O65269.1 RecName: Full=Bifunctional protein FolD 3, chloroplastic; AltName: Full=Tetrahydrofolate dehydrogenase/cyclohydrolase 3; Includes: RecName: Full=Methylenetetrahydrofolate dehydrogenase; Includes: RecName: Full=Methenyltetrahydrofolate cyclohydrolase; Flags: Precursor [Arabidopsis thaliana]AAC13632.1 similar to other dehydrogenase/cyclohydrolase domains [Arabidopsis thaliana]AEE81908.1 Amino acid dehydrogenase family protei|eukprot:NP_191969.1 Amino acid dehydrogenase family protein [Arabidopsis thaliana]